jgi:predicted O-methyltransferase YrrM
MTTQRMPSPLKRYAKEVLAATGRATHVPVAQPSIVDELQKRSITESADMVAPHLGTAALISSHAAMQSFAAARIMHVPDGLFLEFGFHVGNSASVFAPAVRRRHAGPLYAFDAFQGLRDPWSQIDHTQGAFDLGGVPPVPPAGVELIVGWLEDTLPGFLHDHDEPISFVHFDLDVYPPTRFGLEHVKPRLQPGSLLLFDELHGYPGWQHHEWKALNEVFTGDEFEFVAFGPEQALIRIK